VRSHNGYGIDDGDEPDPSGSDDPEAGHAKASGGSAPDDPFEVYFEDGNADPWCPRSLPTPRKWLIVALASAGSFCVTCASSIYTSSYTQMNAELGASHLVATLGLSMFVLGIALGPVWSPLSEFYGRRPIYLAAFAAFTVFIIPCAVARNIETVIVTRFLQGLSGSAFLSVSGGTVSDLFTPEKMHHPMTLFTAAPFLAPSLGPLIGGFINSNLNWRWTHYVMIIWAFCMFLAICFFVPETYRKF
jgi:multidrug resistance protein